MQKTKLRALVLAVIFVSAVSFGVAHAQSPTGNDLTNSQLYVIITASVVGVLIAPIVGYAGQPNTPTQPAQPFNFRQYALALIVGIPTVITLLLGEVTATHEVISGGVGMLVLFLTAFMQGLGVDSLKANISQASQNK